MNTAKTIAKLFASVTLIAIAAALIIIVTGLNMLISEPAQSALITPIKGIEVIVALPKLEAPVASINYSKMTTRELRPMARDRHIPKWNKLNKQGMIEALSA
jgi:predicted tellurium resistance membrane protein TerC